ncbi:MAG: SbcC/MukB-like Walker B domain-containing protein, partial [Methylococcaceae bacterium]
EENIKLALDDAIFRESLLKKMLGDRKHLVDGKPCPLCGALQHPYAKHPPVIGNSLQALVDQQLKIKSLTTRIHNLELQITAAHKRTEKNQAIQTRRQQLSSQWLTLCNRLNIATQELDINNLKLMQQLLKTETDELKSIVSLATKYRSKNTNIENLKTAIDKNVATVEQLQISVQQLEADNQGRSQEQMDIETALANCQQEEKQLAEQISQQLTLLGEKMPAKGKEDELFDRLTVRRQDYHGYAFRRKNLTEELASLATKQLTSQAEITRCNQQLERLTSLLHSEESIGLHLALIEKQKLIVEKEQLLLQQEADVHLLQQALQEKLQATQFISLNELSNALEMIQNQPELEKQKMAVAQDIDNKKLELEKNSVLLESDLKLVEFSLNSEDIAIELIDISEKMAIAKLEAQRMEKLLIEQKLLQQDYDTVLSKLQQQEQQFQPDLAEAALIATETGMDFRRRVQARIADRLLSQTNTMLEKISGRYYLRQKPSEQGLALEIEDTFQNNVRRLPKTLSGGESFVVSLALALGLSELANSGKSVDSLFLDEGFGNLDADSLYTVISTLEGLQTHGKIVGVISHVEAVQKRFKAQLQVVKKPNGLGMLKQAS